MLTNMDKLYESVAANGPVCVGLDTELSYLPATDAAKTAGENVVAFNRALIRRKPLSPPQEEIIPNFGASSQVRYISHLGIIGEKQDF